MAATDPFVAEICIFPFNFVPKGWAWCDGQLLPLSQNTALFSLLGTTYGGNGMSNFALPNMQGCVPMHPGQGPGLSLHDLGESGGADTVTLLASEIPAHSHPIKNVSYPVAAEADTASPVQTYFAEVPDVNLYSSTATQGAPRQMTIVDLPVGGDQPHKNLQPYLTLYFCIALQGVFPPRG
ncbi:Microcystin-dependent protein [Sphingobacterium nematocida]|uniref:Microcystin-dependent protein n=1 Tax=Sphingobacterium nematocida TaxID=1513896 RepID=A0A1T5BNK6_9SPHI|nr:tail fiber protein [Sphingobacterium nematocida]SKB48697.1 Microcystin-dependent protein [Sphingobacterium nematocida]